MKEEQTQSRESRSMGESEQETSIGGKTGGVILAPPKYEAVASGGGGSMETVRKTLECDKGVFNVVLNPFIFKGGQFFSAAEYQPNSGMRSGVKSMIYFTPNENAPDSNEIQFIQIAKFEQTKNGTPTYPLQSSDSRDAKKLITKTEGIKIIVESGDTPESLSQKHTAGKISGHQIRSANNIPQEQWYLTPGMAILIPTVEGGYHVDTNLGDLKDAKNSGEKRKADYIEAAGTGNGGLKNSPGSKVSNNILPARMNDQPSTNNPNGIYKFQTAAIGKDNGINYGVLHWGFKVKDGVPVPDSPFIETGLSGTFYKALAKFNTFFKNDHMVVDGETPESISNDYFGTTKKAQAIIEANGLKSPVLTPGTSIKIPKVSDK